MSIDYKKYIDKPIWQLEDDVLKPLLDQWYLKANNALPKQRQIWDYSYLAYKGIMLNEEINRKRRSNGFNLYVNVPRTFMTIEGIRRNFNINQLKIDIEAIAGVDFTKRYKVKNLLNYDLDRSGTRRQTKDAAFYKVLFGNGFLRTFLMNRKGTFGKIVGMIDTKTGRVKAELDKLKDLYYGMAARSVTPYNIFPDPDGTTLDYKDYTNNTCFYTCTRSVKHITNFKADWKGIIPDELLNEVQPGGKDMTNYEAVRELTDYLFSVDALRYPGTTQDFVKTSQVVRTYNKNEYVEERLWEGEDFMILQAGKNLPLLMVSPNPNPNKVHPLTKLDDIRIPGEFWAMGEPYILRYQQIEENRVHNSILDMLHFAISGMLGINTQYLEDPLDTEIYPEKVWKFKAIPGAKISDVMQNFQSNPVAIAPAMSFMHEIKAVGQSTTSITDFVTGASKSIAETATESNRLAGASDLAIIDKIREMVEEALVDVSKKFLAMYPIAYEGKKIELAHEGKELYFVGKNLDSLSEKSLAQLLTKYEPEDIIYLDDLSINNPKIKVVGDIEVSKEFKFRQWNSAIDFATKINEQAYATGDRRRLDVIKMGIDAMGNFDVIGDPNSYMMGDQAIKADEIKLAGEMNMATKMAGEPGRPGEPKMGPPPTKDGNIRSEAQPTNMGKNQMSKKNQ